VLALVLVPFIDRRSLVHVTRRTVAIVVVVLGAAAWTGLTIAASVTTPKRLPEGEIDFSGPTDWLQLSPEELAGIGFFRQENCVSCHAPSGTGAGIGPDLTARSIHKSAAWMIGHFKHPAEVVPGSPMPPVQLADWQLNALAAFLLRLNTRNASALENAPDFAVQGALIYKENHCEACHMVNSTGGKLAPPLNGLSKRRTREWVQRHFRNPQLLSPGTVMPAYKLPPPKMEAITSYLFVLPG